MIEKKNNKKLTSDAAVENQMLNERFYLISMVKILLRDITYYLVNIKVMDDISALSGM